MAADRSWAIATLLLASALVAPTKASAVSQRFILEPDSTIMPTGGSAQALTGELELTFRGFCTVPFDLATCFLRYDIDSLDLLGGGESIVLGSLAPIFGVFMPNLPDFGIDLPGPPHVNSFVFERERLQPQFQFEWRYFERVLDSADPNTAADPIFDDGPLPSEIFFDLELVEKELLQLSVMGEMQPPRTQSTETVARLTIHAVALPEPGSAVLLALGVGVLCARRSMRRLDSRS